MGRKDRKCNYDPKNNAEYQICNGQFKLDVCEKHYKEGLGNLLTNIARKSNATQEIKILKISGGTFVLDTEKTSRIIEIIKNLKPKDYQNLKKELWDKNYTEKILED
jgi:hypothetical protein